MRPPLYGVIVLLASWISAASSADRPNILFLLADDLGYGDLGSYPSPSTHGKLDTPNIDAFMTESMLFTDAYAGAPVCAPSRCALLTGRHTGHCTVKQNGQVLSENDITIATILKEAGYYTGLVGKWGLGATDNATSFNHPNSMGFDEFAGYVSQENAHNYYPTFLWYNWDTVELKENSNVSIKNCGAPLTKNCIWAEDVFVNESVNFLKTAASQSKKPFYLFVSFTTPHAGGVGTNTETGEPAPYELPQYASQNWSKVERDFASLVSLQDQHVGTILGALDELGLSNNTVVFYTSDNGAHSEGGHDYKFFESSGLLREYKRSLHEGGVRVPLLIRWPGVVKPRTISPQQWSFWDFLKTAADIAGVNETSLPKNIDGYSLLPTLQGMTQEQPKYVYHEYCWPLGDGQGWGQAVRFRDWKAVRYDFNSTVELYDLINDISEVTDVSRFYPSVTEEALQYMDEAHSPGPYCGYKPLHGNT